MIVEKLWMIFIDTDSEILYNINILGLAAIF